MKAFWISETCASLICSMESSTDSLCTASDSLTSALTLSSADVVTLSPADVFVTSNDGPRTTNDIAAAKRASEYFMADDQDQGLECFGSPFTLINPSQRAKHKPSSLPRRPPQSPVMQVKTNATTLVSHSVATLWLC